MNPVDRLLVASFLKPASAEYEIASSPSLLSRAGGAVKNLNGRSKLMAALALAGGAAAGTSAGSKMFGGQQPPVPPALGAAPSVAPKHPQMFPQQHHQLTPEQIQTARMTGMALPSVLGTIAGGIGSFANGGTPLRGAATGLGTGAGWTLGGMAGNAGAQALGVTDPTMRALIGLGTSGAGAYFGNRITGSLVGTKKRRYIEEED